MAQSADPFVETGREIFGQALADMRGAITGTSREALNWRPGADDTNSIAVLVVHSLHSTRTWLSVALDAPQPQRDRDSEFLATAADAATLLAAIDAVERDCVALLGEAGIVDWSALRQAHSRPGSDAPRSVPAAWAFVHALEHLREHVGQMLLTRQLWDAARAG